MSDAIRIEGLAVEARVGVYDWERQTTRPLLLDLDLTLDLGPAGVADALERTIDYQAVADLAAEVAGANHHALIEAYAERLAQALFARFPCRRLALVVYKPGAIPRARAVSVRIEREAADYSV